MRLFTTGLLLFFVTFLLAQTTHQVAVTSNVFTPSSLTIQVGDIVNWTNNQGFHNVNGSLATYPANPEGFRSGNAAPAGWMFSHTFTIPGTYTYQCDPHVGLGMVGTIVVEDVSAAEDIIVITEINYNPPAEDSFEYIEFINLGAAPVDLTDWTISSGVVFTFPAATLAPGEFMIVTGNMAAFMNVFPGYTGQLFQWTSGGTNNTGETIAISNAAGIVIDEVPYSDSAPWPTAADGGGATLVLCDFASDNTIPFNWQAASTSTGLFFGGVEFFANPGANSECAEQVPQIYFLTDNLTRTEGDATFTVDVIAQGFTTGFGPEFQVVFDAQSTATEFADFSTSPTLPISFSGGETALDTFSFTVTIIDDANAESDENLVLRLVSQSATPDSLIFITIRDNDSEVVVTPIGDINDVDADGVAISIGQAVTLRGVVHCIDFDGNAGYQFWIVDENGDGIFVFNTTDVDGYVVTEGDQVLVSGTIDQFNGLLELADVTQIAVESQNNDLTGPIEVTTLNESLENVLVTLTNITGVAENAILRAGGGYNVAVLTETNDTITLRVEDEINVDSVFLANWLSNSSNSIFVTGFVNQRDFNLPLDGFYQIYPCGEASFQVETSVNEPTWASDLKIYPNPTSGLLQINASVNLEVIRLIDLTGRELQRSQVFGEQQRLNISNLPSGTYFLQLISGNEVVTRPVVKQ